MKRDARPWTLILQSFCQILLCQMVMKINQQAVKGSSCLGGEDIFAAVRENSPDGQFIANLSIAGEPRPNGMRLALSGDSADWFYLEENSIRLNASVSRALDREVHGSVLMAVLSCYEGETIQSEYRIMVEILNENDNKPVFMEETVQPVTISELAAVNSVVFVVKAVDADEDTIVYVIDRSLPDSSYFRIDLPNSGDVILSKPLDYETKTQMQLAIYAVEMNTPEMYNTSATIMIDVLDGDDQYPQFQPCVPLTQDTVHPICTNPIYTANVTEAHQNITLPFAPGRICAVDGDRGLDAPLLYTILSGADDGRFHIDKQSGEVTMSRPAEQGLLVPTFQLQIMASQVDDPRKYAITSAVVRVLAQNHFAPQFNSSTYFGFVPNSSESSVLISTHGNQALLLQATDHDFQDGINPKVHYSLWPKSNNTRLYHMTQEGYVIAKRSLLPASEKDFLEVIARDQESGEVARATVEIVAIQRGERAPWSLFGGQKRYILHVDVVLAGGIVAVVLLLLLVTVMFLLLWLVRRWRQQQEVAAKASVAQGKHPNVVNSGRPTPHIEEISFCNEAYEDCETSGSLGRGLHGKKPGILRRKTQRNHSDSTDLLRDSQSLCMTAEPLPIHVPPSIMSNGKAADRLSKSVSFVDDVTLREIRTAENPRNRSLEVQTVESIFLGEIPQEPCETEEGDRSDDEREAKNLYKVVYPVKEEGKPGETENFYSHKHDQQGDRDMDREGCPES
ncbi:cadherin-related family member 5-like isoform X2 [Brienomyrus brachyistius]|uniref:cadherin-related family member 5-like isoform X2 n=1 Tax=Brienomyrus brachyistius TaxID=42636 RepID=UPI0020B1D613|nr:cadherin-related family member 5-like isoform X2 [Brienomyrus brachyistius]